MIFCSESESQTHRFAASLAGYLEPGLLIALDGSLGAGKTRFVQGLAAGLDVPGPVSSPTYTLAIPHSGRLDLLHVDLWRVETAEELADLAIDQDLAAGVVVAVEWFGRFAGELPTPDLTVSISEGDSPSMRIIKVRAKSPRGEAILERMEPLADWNP